MNACSSNLLWSALTPEIHKQTNPEEAFLGSDFVVLNAYSPNLAMGITVRNPLIGEIVRQNSGTQLDEVLWVRCKGKEGKPITYLLM